jgi:hypothetical protein
MLDELGCGWELGFDDAGGSWIFLGCDLVYKTVGTEQMLLNISMQYTITLLTLVSS